MIRYTERIPVVCTPTARLVAALFPVALAGCIANPPLRATALDPSNPAAPESPFPTASAPESPPQDGPAHAPESAHAASIADAGSTVYACPMHPDVRQLQPGRCPKCGMTLAPAGPAMPMSHPKTDGAM